MASPLTFFCGAGFRNIRSIMRRDTKSTVPPFEVKEFSLQTKTESRSFVGCQGTLCREDEIYEQCREDEIYEQERGEGVKWFKS